MFGVESEIDKLNHPGVGFRQLNDELLRFDTPEPHRPCPKVCLCPLSIPFINCGLEIANRGRLIVERGESYDGSIRVIKRYLPRVNSLRILAVW